MSDLPTTPAVNLCTLRPATAACTIRGNRQTMTQYVYRFGGGVSDGGKGDKNLLGGKGANLAEMASIGLPVPPGFTISHRDLRASITTRAAAFPPSLRDEVADRPRAYRGGHRQDVRRRRRSAARLGPLGRARVDAGDDGHRPQPRPQRRRPSRASPQPRATRASPGTAIAASSRCTPTWCSTSITTRSRKRWRSPRKTSGYHARHRADRRRLAGAGRRVQGARRGAVGQALPAGRPRPAVGRDRRGVRLVAVRARQGLSPPATTSPASWGTAVNVQAMVFGNMGDTSATGVAFTRDPAKGDTRLLRRIPDQRAGRGRRRRHPHAAISDQGRARGGRRQAAVDGRGDARGLSPSWPAVFDLLETPLPRHAGHRVHGASSGKLWMLQTRSASAPPRPR